MNQMEIFKNPEFGSVRVIDEDGKYLFCGTDVARALGYSIPSKAVNTHCKGVSKMEAPTSGGVQKLLFIPEGDVYRLIVHSKLPSAERFERWVFDEVLPSIRQHGAYLTREKLWEVATSPEALLKLCSDLLAEREKNARMVLAEVEKDISSMLVDAAHVYEENEVALRLRTMHLLYESVKGSGGTVVIPSAYSEGFSDAALKNMADSLKTPK